MSTTIDSLDIQITTSAGQAEVKIERLADALGKLKENGKITVATNGMEKLAEALKTLNPALNDMNPAKLQQLRAAMAGLSGIQKMSGLSSAVNTLKKIPDVVSSLDTSVLTKFTALVDRLSDALGPLATKIDKIGTGFSKLPQRISKTVTVTNKMAAASEKAAVATEKHSKAINATSLNIMSAIHNFESMVHVLHIVTDAMTKFMADAMEWDGIQHRFGRAFGEDAEEVYQYVLKINDVLGINIQQFMQYSSLYGSLLSGFGMQQEKVTAISVGLTELSYDIWAAYNDRFKTLEDASEAVRSAITGEIEPIRNAGIALTEASMQEYLDSIGMAHVSIEKLTEAQKAEVRYAVMMNAAMNQGIVGTYASEMKTAEGAVRSLSQSVKSLTQALGSLFIPLLQWIVPYLTAFVELLYEAVAAVAGFFGISFFEIDWSNDVGDLAGGMGDAADSAGGVASGLDSAAAAAKKIRDYTMGFDELNVISPPSASGSGGGAGAGGAGDNGWGDGLDLDTLWNESVFAKASKQVDELKQKIKDWFEEWKTEIAIVGAALAALSVASLLTSLGSALHLGEVFLGTMTTIKKLAATAIVITLQYTLMGEFLDSFIEEGSWKDYIAAMIAAAIGTGVLYSQWKTGGLFIGLAVTAVASFKATFADGSVDSAEEVTTGVTGLATALAAIGLAWPKVKPVFDGIVEFFKAAKAMAPEVGWLAALFPKLSGAFSSIATWVTSAAKAVGSFIGGLSGTAIAVALAVILAIVSAVYFLYKNWEKVKKAVTDFFAENIAPKLEEIKKHFEKIGEAIQPVIDLFKKFGEWIGGVVEDIKAFLVEFGVLEFLFKRFEMAGGLIFSVIGGVIATAFNMLVGIIENVVQTFSGFVQIIGGIVDFIVALFSGGDIGEAWGKIWDGVVDVVSGLWGLITDPIVDLVEGIIGWFTELWDELVGHSIVPDTVNGIVEWFTGMPGRIMDSIRKFVEDVLQKFRDMWTKIKSWFSTNVAPKFTLSYWKGVFGKVVQGAGDKLTELKTKISEKWTSVKTWFTTNVAPKFTLKYWGDKFQSITDGLGEKLEDAWEKVKEFFSFEEWKKKVEDAIRAIKENFKLPEFPKIKLSVEWDTNVGKVKTAVYKALGLEGWPKLSWSTYATGGFPSMGEMFIAREAGPEMVGTIGSRSAVVNNDQIVEAVSRGVYSAVVAAMSSNNGNGSQNVNVYLDGKQIYTSVKRVEAERGVSVMGNQLGYAY